MNARQSNRKGALTRNSEYFADPHAADAYTIGSAVFHAGHPMGDIESRAPRLPGWRQAWVRAVASLGPSIALRYARDGYSDFEEIRNFAD